MMPDLEIICFEKVSSSSGVKSLTKMPQIKGLLRKQNIKIGIQAQKDSITQWLPITFCWRAYYCMRIGCCLIACVTRLDKALWHHYMVFNNIHIFMDCFVCFECCYYRCAYTQWYLMECSQAVLITWLPALSKCCLYCIATVWRICDRVYM